MTRVFPDRQPRPAGRCPSNRWGMAPAAVARLRLAAVLAMLVVVHASFPARAGGQEKPCSVVCGVSLEGVAMSFDRDPDEGRPVKL